MTLPRLGISSSLSLPAQLIFCRMALCLRTDRICNAYQIVLQGTGEGKFPESTMIAMDARRGGSRKAGIGDTE